LLFNINYSAHARWKPRLKGEILKDGPFKPDSTQPITSWLYAARDGDKQALSQLFDSVYPLLRRMASSKPGVEKDGALTPTVVVNELFLKINNSDVLNSEDRHHFYATCSKAMRYIIVDFARSAMSQKRGGEFAHCAYTQALATQPDRAQELLDIHAALDDLDQVDHSLRELVELKFFGGLTYAEIGAIYMRSERSIKRDWTRARAFLAARSMQGLHSSA
jgi:RNA polymerase sigma factor (TIGR02999 family)